MARTAKQVRGGMCWGGQTHRVQELAQAVAVLDADDGREGVRLVVDLHRRLRRVQGGHPCGAVAALGHRARRRANPAATSARLSPRLGIAQRSATTAAESPRATDWYPSRRGVDERELQYLREAPGILPCRACTCDSSTLRRTCWHVSSTQQSKENDTLLEHSRCSPTLATLTRAGQPWEGRGRSTAGANQTVILYADSSACPCHVWVP